MASKQTPTSLTMESWWEHTNSRHLASGKIVDRVRECMCVCVYVCARVMCCSVFMLGAMPVIMLLKSFDSYLLPWTQSSEHITELTEHYTAQKRCGLVGSTLAFGSIGHGLESEHRLFSHHGASAFSKLRSLAKCSLDDSVRRLLSFTPLATLRWGRIE